MLEDNALLKVCLDLTGKFENGVVAYDHVAGNFDGMGISVGILQWNAGTGSLQILLHNIGDRMGWGKLQSFFSSDIHAFANMPAIQAIEFAKDHYLVDSSSNISMLAAKAWRNMLSQPESMAAQQDMAIKGPFARSKTLVNQYVPSFADRSRPYVFFFDLINQSGGMTKKINGVWQTIPVVPESQTISWQQTLSLAKIKDTRCYTAWSSIFDCDSLACILGHYAWERAQWSRPEYIWDGLSRRTVIATRVGHVHGVNFDLTLELD